MVNVISYRQIIPYACLLTVFMVHSGAKCQDKPGKLYPVLQNYAKNLYKDYRNIPEVRKRALEDIANYIYGAIQIDKKASILFTGTNNSTRSILAQAWSEAAAHYYNINNVEIFSGGTQPSAIEKSTILALEAAGFIIYKTSNEQNPRYEIKYTYNLDPLIMYSKKYNDRNMPHHNYGAIFVCPNADLNVPYEEGMNFRSSIHYFDPMAYNGTQEEIEMYKLRSREIAIEMFYIFYSIKNKSL